MRKTTILFTFLLVCVFNVTRSQVTSYSLTASSAAYTPIVGGNTPTLTGNGIDVLSDEGYSNNIPLQFNFKYLGKSYTSISISTNGFASFGTLTSTGFSNNISAGSSTRPLLAPLWEDLALASPTDFQYTTTGSLGNRVFIVQWSNVYFDFGSSAPSLSFQLRLYETSNVIEFVYDKMQDLGQNYSGGASIGITGQATGNGNFLSLNNTSAAPTASSAVATNTIITCPASGQVYRFTPPSCSAPGSLTVTTITSTSAMFSWADDAGGSGYQYNITTSPVGPASGTNGGGGSFLPIGGLTPGTQYYLHVRTNCGGGVFSGWSTLGFTTLCDATSIPYIMPITGVNTPALPLCTTVKDENQDGNTWRSYPSAGEGWTNQVVAYVYNPNETTAANDWLFTAGLNLTGGTTYRLKFKYNNDRTTLYPEKMKVAYGNATTAQAMTNILADYPSVSNPTPKTASIDFTPSASGVYYIGFQAYSLADKNVLILDDISVDQRPSCDLPSNLKVIVQSTAIAADISWTAPAQGSPSGYQYAVTTNATPPASGTFVNGISTVAGSLIPNTQYYLHVRTQCDGVFSDWVTLTFATVPNDEPCQAIELIRGGAPVCVNNTLATTSPKDPLSNCSNPNNTVWFKYTPVESGTITLHITTPGSPAHPLHGWAGWSLFNGNCDNPFYTVVGFCSSFGDNGNNDTDDLISPFLNGGVTYYIMVDGFSDEVGEFCISVPSCPPPLSMMVTDVLSSSALVKWKGSGNFIIEYGPSGFTPGTSDAAGGGTIINATINNIVNAQQAITGLNVLTTYDVYIRHNCSGSSNGYSNNSAVASFTTLGQPPPNDNCSGAITIPIHNLGCTSPTAGTTTNATPSFVLPLPSCGNGSEGYDDDVWFKFIPAAGQFGVNVELHSTGGDYDLVAQIYTTSDNTCGGTFTTYRCSDDDGPGNEPIFNSMQVTPGKTYYIRVFSYEKGVNSQFSVCVTANLIANDNAPGAIPLTVGAGCTGAPYTNESATQSANEPTGSCSSLTGYSTVWFKFVAPSGGAVRISTAAGTGNTLTNSRVALFSAQDPNDYSTFNIISCDEDGGAAPFAEMSVLYATGLNPGATYYIQVDRSNTSVSEGKFCITVDMLHSTLISTSGNCGSTNQNPVGSIPSYSGWVSLMDAESKLIALVRNTAGGSASAYNLSHNINVGAPRIDPVSGEYYYNRSYLITNATTGNANINVQFFFPNAELTAYQAYDPAGSIYNLRVTRQSGSVCSPDFVAANGTNVEVPLSSTGTQNGVSWMQFTTTSFSNFYIHSTRSTFTGKVFLQGAYNATLGRHKDVTPVWANVLNTFARTQPYYTQFGYIQGTETVPNGFFKSTSATTDIVDWVFLEAKNSSGTLMSRSVAFVREDGQLVNMDGVSPASLHGLATGNYYITISHRNHFGISTENLLPFNVKVLGVAPITAPDFDFTTASDAAIFGNDQAFRVINGKNVMIGGNANGNNNLRYSGLQNDPGSILSYLGNPLFTLSNVYSSNDVNLDGLVRYSGLSNDTGFLLSVLGSPLPTIFEQKR